MNAKRYYTYKETHRKVKGVRQNRSVKCMKWKRQSVREFCRDRYRKDGLRLYGKACDKAYGVEYRQRHRRDDLRGHLRLEPRHQTVRKVRQKLCTRCGIWKDERDFCADRNSGDGLTSRCKECLTGEG